MIKGNDLNWLFMMITNIRVNHMGMQLTSCETVTKVQNREKEFFSECKTKHLSEEIRKRPVESELRLFRTFVAKLIELKNNRIRNSR